MAAYATANDIAARLGRTLDPTVEVPKVNALLDDVSGMVTGFCRRVFNPVPDDVKAVVCSEVIAIFNSNPGIVVEHVGDLQVEYVNTAGSLSEAGKNTIRHYRKTMVSVQLTIPFREFPDFWSGNRNDF